MKSLKYIFLVLLCSLAAAPGRSEVPVSSSEKTPETRTEKPARRLKGEFKGHPIATPPETESEQKPEPPKTAAKKASADKKAAGKSKEGGSEKPLVLDNAMVAGDSRHAGGKGEAPRPASDSSGAPPPAPVTAAAPVDLNGNGEAYWRARAAQLREALARARQTLETAELEEKREENDFYAWDDGQYRDNVIKPAWDRSKEETARAREALAAAQKSLDDLEDDARKAGAYPGWIRE